MQVLDHLAERGFDEVAEVTTAEERLTFSLPQELKRDMKAAAAQRAGPPPPLAATSATVLTHAPPSGDHGVRP